MKRRLLAIMNFIALLVSACQERVAIAATFRVATYNVENYIDEATLSRRAKSEDARAKVRESILALKPDVLALQEMGSVAALQDLRAALKKDGLDFPYWEHVTGYDTNVHVAILSRLPIAARHPHTNDDFLLNGRRFHVSRGFAEAQIAVSTNYSFTLITAHLKSKRPIPQADEAELRLEEAKILREKIDACFAANPGVNLVILGDLNDTKDAASTKTVIGKGKTKLVDTRPAERNGDVPSGNRVSDQRTVTWTHFFGKEDLYSRVDYILLSPAMARHWLPNETYILTVPNWGLASDHRPLVATFQAADN